MPLLDHFRPPLHPRHRWESFHSNWATRLADDLSDRLPPDYIAEEHTYGGGRTEVDIAAFEDDWRTDESGDGVAVAAPKLYMPPACTLTVPAMLPDSFEVRVYQKVGGLTLVGAIELVSPANKDRPEERQAFAAKVASLLHQGVSVIVVDVVTSRRANLHNETMMLFSDDSDAQMASDLYAVAYRPVLRHETPELDLWLHPLALGEPLPVLPLRLTGDTFVPVDLDSSYREACRRRRLG